MHRSANRLARFLAIVLFGTLLALPSSPAPVRAHEPLENRIDDVTHQLERRTTASGFLERGELRRIEGRYDDAFADYDRAESLDSTLLEVDLCRGALFLEIGKPEAALHELDHFLDHVPNHPEALRLHGRAQFALGHAAEAVSDFDRAIVFDERPTPDHYFERARTLATLGDEGKTNAVRGLDQGMERLGPAVTLASLAIDLEVELGRYDEALARLDRIAPQFERSALVLERRGRILLAAGRRDEARGAYVAALAELESHAGPRANAQSTSDLELRVREALTALADPNDGAATPHDAGFATSTHRPAAGGDH